MELWLSYSLRDFLIFSPDAYFRLYELTNLALWPFHIPLILLSLVVLYMIRLRHVLVQKALLVWLAIIWLFVGFWFLRTFYSQINTLAYPLSYLFFCEAALLVLSGFITSRTVDQESHVTVRTIGGWVLILYAYFIHPVTAIHWERSFAGIEVFAVAPDPTAIGTLGFLMLLRTRGYLYLMIIPCIWLTFSILTYMAF